MGYKSLKGGIKSIMLIIDQKIAKNIDKGTQKVQEEIWEK